MKIYTYSLFIFGVLTVLIAIHWVSQPAGAAQDSVPPVVVVSETRCGWFVNPTPANAWLTDAQGEWIIGVQGGYQAEGDWPEFKDSQWVKTNNNYGYGCACMKVNVNKSDEKILNIISSYAKALSACRKDKALKRKEPKD